MYAPFAGTTTIPTSSAIRRVKRWQSRQLRLEVLEARILLAVDAFPVPVTAVDPQGSLIHTTSIAADINTPSDHDLLTIELDDEQTVSLVVTPQAGLRPSVELLSPDATVLAAATADAAGQALVVQTIATDGAGTYTVGIGGADGTTGDYTVQLILSAAVESESHSGEENSTLASAEDLGGSFFAIGPTADRGAIIGSLSSLTVTDLGPGVNTAQNDQNPSLSADGLTLLFSSDRPGGMGATDVYMATRTTTDEAFGGVTNLGPQINSADADAAPSISADGLILFYHSNRVGGSGRQDLYMATRATTSDPFGNLQSLGPSVNTSANETNPSISADGRSLYFSSNRGGGFGNTDIYVATRASVFDPFTGVTNVGSGVNSPSTDARPSISSDEMTLYFQSNRPGGSGGQDIYMATRASRTGSFGDPIPLGGDVNTPSNDLAPDVGLGGGGVFLLESDRPGGAGATDLYQASDTDWYRFTLTDGQAATLALTSLTGQRVGLSLYDAAGSQLTTAATADNVGQVIDGFVDTTNDGAVDTYYARVNGASTDYSLVVTRDADFDIEPNDDLGDQAQDITRTGSALGGLGRQVTAITEETEPNDDGVPGGSLADLPFANDLSGSFVSQGGDTYEAVVTGTISAGNDTDWDFFKVLASPGDTLAVTLRGAPSGSGTLGDPYLRLFDNMGAQIASNDDFFGLESFIEFNSFSYVGDYYIVADSFGSSTGTYTLTAELTTTDPVIGSAGGDDYFAVEAVAGDRLTVDTQLPGSGPGQFVNKLDVAVELYDPSGQLVASGPDGGLSYLVTESGTHTVHLLAEDDSTGVYVVSVTGQTGLLPPFTVAATEPADAARLTVSPTQIRVDFSSGILLTTLDAADLTIDGTAAQDVMVIDFDTALFELSSDLAEGSHDVAIAGGAIVDLQGRPLEPYAGTLAIDTTGPQVFATSIAEGNVIPAATPLTVAITMSEPLDTANLDAADVVLIGALGGPVVPQQLDFDPQTAVLSLEYAPLPEDDYTLTLVSGDGAFEDLVGNDLDGFPSFPLPSGNGTPGGDFVLTFSAEIGVAPFPALVPDVPLGSLIYTGLAQGIIGAAADEDLFEIGLDADQTVSVVVDPASQLQPTIELIGPDSAVLATAVAAATGQPAVLQTIPVSGPGAYLLAVASAAGTTGRYAVELVLNAAVEEERYGGASTNDPASAQDLDNSFLALGPDGIGRSAVIAGLTTPDVTSLGPGVNSAENEESPNLSTDGLTLFFNSARPDGVGDNDLYMATRTTIDEAFGAVTNLGPQINSPLADSAPSVSADGMTLFFHSRRNGGRGGSDLYMATRATLSDPFTNPLNLGPFVNTTANETNPSISADGRSLYFNSNRGGGFGGADIYVATRASVNDAFTSVTPLGLGINSGSSDAQPSISDDGTTLYFQSNRPGGLGGTDVYVATRQSLGGAFGTPALVRGSVNTVSNDRAPDIGLGGSLLLFQSDRPGGAGGSDLYQASDTDWYRFTLAGGQSASLTLSSLAGETASLALYGNDLSRLARGIATETSNQVIDNFVSPVATGTTETYFAQVTGSVEDYSLVVTRGLEFDTERNAGFDTAQEITQTGVILGHVDNGATAGVIGGGATFDTPLLSFDGAGFNGVTPPDPVGDVGIDHYIQMVNHPSGSLFTIYDKTDGSVVQGPTVLSTLAPAGTPGASGRGDPIVLYDQLADRWLLSEFSAVANGLSIYISQTSDPTDNLWHHYFVSTPDFPDYPKYGVWQDAYFVATNESNPTVYALDRNAMLEGLPMAPAQRFTAPPLAGFGFQALIPSDLDGPASPDGSTGYFMRHRDDEVHNPGANDPLRDFLEVWEFHVDFSTPANSAFTQITDVPITEFDSDLCGLFSFDCFPQPGTTIRLDPLREVIMHRLQYRNFGDYEALVGNLVTDVDGTDHGGVRWFELRKDGVGPWTLHQEGTVAPDANHRWMGSIAMDGAQNIALGYSISSSIVSPGIRYTGRLQSDPLGTMPRGEHMLVDGIGFNGSERWGDYSAMTVDPVDDRTFWFTGEYADSGVWATRIGSFRLAEPFDEDWYEIEVRTGDLLTLETTTPFDGPLELVNVLDPAVQLYDPTGALVGTDDNSAADGHNARLVHRASESGSYRIRTTGVETAGEYVLRVTGQSGLPPAFEVIATEPLDGAQFDSEPTRMRIDFSDTILLSSLDAADLTVDGRAALGVTAIDGDTAIFDLPAGLGEGPHNVTIAEGAIVDLRQTPVDLYFGSFGVDMTGPQLTFSSLQEGDVTSTDALTYVAVFSEAIDDALLDPSDIALVDAGGVLHPPVAFDYATDTLRLTAEFAGLLEGPYTLGLRSGDGAFEDLVGNDLDGEPVAFPIPPNWSGDGVPGGDFSVGFEVDYVSSPADDFARIEPFGSLIAASTGNGGLVNVAGDEDDLTVFIEAGQTVTATVTPDDPAATLQLSLVGITSPLVAPAAGEAVILPPQPIAADGVYAFRIGGDAPTGYTLEIFRNVVLEAAVGDSGDGNPLPIDSARIVVGPGMGRSAAIGVSTPTSVTLDGIVFGVQPATGQIVKMLPATGIVLDSFAAPDSLAPNHTQIGLSIAEGGSSLIYVNSDIDPTTLWRLDPVTGAVLSTESLVGYPVDALGFEGGTSPPNIFLSHRLTDLHRQEGFSGTDTHGWAVGSSVGGLGGDDAGRQFAYFYDGSIHEFDPLVDTNSYISTLPAPAADIEGMAFDGTRLFVSTASGALFTLDPDTGAQLDADIVPGGALFGLAAIGEALGGESADLIVNGGFETGDFSGWTATSNGLGELTPWTVSGPGGGAFGVSAPLSGSFSALNGFDGDAGLEYQLYQDVTIPAVAPVTLTTNHRIVFDGFGIPSTLDRRFEISIRNTNNTVLETLLTQNITMNGAPFTDLGYAADTFDLSDYAGQTVRIHFREFIPESFTGAAMLEYDDIALTYRSGDVPTTLPDTDQYVVDLTGKTGETIDIVVAGHGDVDLSRASLQLFDVDGVSLLANGSADPLGVPATNYAVGIRGFTVPADGIYTIRLRSAVPGEYGLLVTDSLHFESEPNDTASDPLVQLDQTGSALGFLGAEQSGNLFADPEGDTFGFGSPQIDIAGVGGQVAGGNLTLTASFFSPIAAPSSGLPEAIAGVWDLDLDQDATTGTTSYQSIFSPPDQQGGPLGDEALVDIFSEAFQPGLVNVLDTFSGGLLAQAPITFGPNSFEIVIPLDQLGDDGALNFGTVFGTSSEPTDSAPNTVFGTTLSPVTGPAAGGRSVAVTPTTSGPYPRKVASPASPLSTSWLDWRLPGPAAANKQLAVDDRGDAGAKISSDVAAKGGWLLAATAGAQPHPAALTTYLPEGITFQDVAAQLHGSDAASAKPDAASLTGLLAVDEAEPNDTIALANPVPLGFEMGEDPSVAISGTLTPSAPPARIIATEPDGALPLATPTGLVSGSAIIASATIGDGSFGSTSGDYDWYAVADVVGGQTITVDIDAADLGSSLDPVVGIYDSGGGLLASNDDAGGSLDSYLSFTAPAIDDYYVVVRGFGGSFQTDPTDPASGSGVGSTGPYDVTIGLDAGGGDIDFFRVELQPGDIFGASVNGSAGRVSLRDEAGLELIGSSQDVTFIHPAASPLPGGGNAALSWVTDTAGSYYVAVTQGSGAYELDLGLFRAALEESLQGEHQILFLDFDGETFDTSIFGGGGITTLSPLTAFLSGWGLTTGDESRVIDAIVASVEESLSTDMRTQGLNGDFDATGVPGQFDIEILNSRDDADPFGQPNVSRVIVGGTIGELGISTIGIAESIDVGNFETAETAVVLLDLLSAPAFDPNSLNQYGLDPSATIFDLVGTGVGNITAHEAGHFFASWHTDQFNSTPDIMDQGGNLDNTVGVGFDRIFGSGDDFDVDFGNDTYVPNEGFTGVENTLNATAFGLATGTLDLALVGPTVTAFELQGAASIDDFPLITGIEIGFSETIATAPAVDAINYRLLQAGPNGLLEAGAGDDVTIPVMPRFDGDALVQLEIDSHFAPLAPGTYQLTIDGSDQGIVDLDGNPLNSRSGPGGGRDDIRQFDLAFEFAAGADLYQVDLDVGHFLTVQTGTPLDSPSARVRNDLDPRLVVFDPTGMPVATDDNGLDGKNALIDLVASVAGAYTIQVVGESGAGEYLLETSVADSPPLGGDMTGDGIVDGRDVDPFVNTLVGGSYRTAADMDRNGNVNGLDVDLFISQLLSGGDTPAVDGSLVAASQLAVLPSDPTRSVPLRDQAVAGIAAELDRSLDHSAALAGALADVARGNDSRRDRQRHDPRAALWHTETWRLAEDRLEGLDGLATARARARAGSHRGDTA